MGQVRGRRTVQLGYTGILLLGFLSMTLSLAVAGPQFNVGDESGWTINVNYTDWAAKQTFYDGDTIVFSYPRGTHNVLRVSPEDYDACKVSNPIETDETGHSAFQLRAGTYYFICGFPAHCELLQKVSFNVEPAPGSLPSPLVDNSTSSHIPNYIQGAEAPIAYGPSPTGAFAPGSAPTMFRPSFLHSLILLAFGFLLGSCGSNFL